MLSVEMLGSHLVFWLCSAGPAPDSEPELGEEEMIGEESDSDSGNDAAEQRAQLSISRPQVQQQKRQRLMPRDSSLQHLKGLWLMPHKRLPVSRQHVIEGIIWSPQQQTRRPLSIPGQMLIRLR